MQGVLAKTLESLSNSVFERRTSTGSGLFASLGSGLVQTLGQIVFIREKKLSNTNLLESRHIKEKKASLPVDVRRSKTSLLKLPNTVNWERETCGKDWNWLPLPNLQFFLPVPGSEIGGSTKFKKRQHEKKTGGNWGEEDRHRPLFPDHSLIFFRCLSPSRLSYHLIAWNRLPFCHWSSPLIWSTRVVFDVVALSLVNLSNSWFKDCSNRKNSLIT